MEDYSNARIAQVIDDYIHNERNRQEIQRLITKMRSM